ncbi:hypothetical protein O0L34_g17301 [Tuta absoluta]|nr:hypothetical protein O0L34_g17301 [Tuta absoluta]
MAVLKILVLLSLLMTVLGKSVTLQFEFEDILRLLPYLAKSDQLRSIASVFARSAKVSADLATPSKYHNPYHPEDDIMDLAETVLSNITTEENSEILTKKNSRFKIQGTTFDNLSNTSQINTKKEYLNKKNYNDSKQLIGKEEAERYAHGIAAMSSNVQKLLNNAGSNKKNLLISLGTPKFTADITEKPNNHQPNYNNGKPVQNILQNKNTTYKSTENVQNLSVVRLKNDLQKQNRDSDTEKDNDNFVKESKLSEDELFDFASDVASLSASVRKITKGSASENAKNKLSIPFVTPKFSEDIPKSTGHNYPDKTKDKRTDELKQEQIDIDIENNNEIFLKQSMLNEKDSKDSGNDSESLRKFLTDSFITTNLNDKNKDNSSYHQRYNNKDRRVSKKLQKRFLLKRGPTNIPANNSHQSMLKTYDDNLKKEKMRKRNNSDRKYAGFVVRAESSAIKPIDRFVDKAELEMKLADNIASKALGKSASRFKLPDHK